MKECEICKASLGVFAKKYTCKDGYVCDDCYRQSKIRKMRNEVTVREIKDSLFSKERSEERAKRKLEVSHTQERNKTNPTQTFIPTTDGSLAKYIALNENTHKFTILGRKEIYNYSQLVSFEYLENGHTIEKSQSAIGRAVVGGVIAGGVGAIVGASSANVISNEIITQMAITVTINPGAVTYSIRLLDVQTKNGSLLYNLTKSTATQLIGYLKSIEQYNLQQNNKQLQTNTPEASISVPEQIKQYKELLDCGAITQEEYDAKKKQLLGL